jgi:FKBP-type peptidyl-prolyl cis-trans isomerase
MRARVLAAACAIAGLVSAGCLDDSTGVGCQQVGSLVTSTSGDTATTSSGLRYIDTELGTGATAASCQAVAVNYRGMLLDGTPFDSLQNYPVVPGTFQAIAGFEQGIVGMKVGGSRRLIIPPALGYGSTDIINRNTNEVVIPANSTIVFDVELVGVSDVTYSD